MATKFMEMKKRIEVLEVLDEKLADMEKELRQSFEVIFEEVTNEQETHWKTGELLWEDEAKTIPKYKVRREWGYVDRTEPLDDEEEVKLRVIEEVRKALLKMV